MRSAKAFGVELNVGRLEVPGEKSHKSAKQAVLRMFFPKALRWVLPVKSPAHLHVPQLAPAHLLMFTCTCYNLQLLIFTC